MDAYERAAGSRRLYYRVLQFLSQAIFALYFRGRVFDVRNVPTAGPVLLACNHQSYFDPISATVALHREGNYMARDTLFRNPFFKRLIHSLNAFPVRRGEADVGAVKEIMRRLKQGRLVVVFPEATRTRDGSIGRMNANSLAIAKKCGAAIVPTAIDGAFEAWPRGQALPIPKPMHVTYAPCIPADLVQALSAEELADLVSRRLAQALARSNARRAAIGRPSFRWTRHPPV